MGRNQGMGGMGGGMGEATQGSELPQFGGGGLLSSFLGPMVQMNMLMNRMGYGQSSFNQQATNQAQPTNQTPNNPASDVVTTTYKPGDIGGEQVSKSGVAAEAGAKASGVIGPEVEKAKQLVPVEVGKAGEEEQLKQAISHNESFNSAFNVIKASMPTLKEKYANQGGTSGYVPGVVGGIAAKYGLPGTRGIAQATQAFQDMKANLVKQYSGNQGISKLFDAFTDGPPTELDSEENAIGKMVMAGKAVYAITKGASNANWTAAEMMSKDPNLVYNTINNDRAGFSQKEGLSIEKLIQEEYKNAPIGSPNGQTPKVNAFNAGINSIFPNGGGTKATYGGGSSQTHNVDMIDEQGVHHSVHPANLKKAEQLKWKMASQGA